MNQMNRRQSGMTAIGYILVLGVLACAVAFVLRIFPLYNEYFSVKAAMESTRNQPAASLKTTRDVRKVFLKNVQLNNVSWFNDKTAKDHVFVIKPKKKGEPRLLNVKYDAKNILFQNVYLMMIVDESVALDAGGAE
jgi:hypothetical protein